MAAERLLRRSVVNASGTCVQTLRREKEITHASGSQLVHAIVAPVASLIKPPHSGLTGAAQLGALVQLDVVMVATRSNMASV